MLYTASRFFYESGSQGPLMASLHKTCFQASNKNIRNKLHTTALNKYCEFAWNLYFCNRGLRTFHLYHLSFTVTDVSLSSNFLWDTMDQSIITWMQQNSTEQATSFFLLQRHKALIFLMSWALSAVTYHSESDTVIINYSHRDGTQPKPELSTGWCRESYVAWLHREPYWLSLMFLLNQSPSPIGHFFPFGKTDDGDGQLHVQSLSLALRRFHQET